MINFRKGEFEYCLERCTIQSIRFIFKAALYVCFSYDNLDVPDTMNVHGIYDTAAFMMTFESRTQYQQYLQREAGVSGSVFGFSAGVKKAWGGSMQASTQQYMAVLDVDIDR